MNLADKRWKNLFLFCLGTVASVAICMKWLENEFWSDNEKFTMVGLEVFYSKEKIMAILSGLDSHVRSVLRHHLHFDFVFMAGIFPGIAALCMMAREKTTAPALRNFLFILAWMQLLAWGGDITEDLYLLKWIKDPAIGNDFGLYHIIVYSKWIIALTAFLIVVSILLSRLIKPGKLFS